MTIRSAETDRSTFSGLWRRSRDLVAKGADIIDVGAESARTNRPPITRRGRTGPLTAVSEPIFQACGRILNRGTQARPSLLCFPLIPGDRKSPLWRSRSGGHLLNDLGSLQDDRNARICARTGAALLIMHSVGIAEDPSHARHLPGYHGGAAPISSGRKSPLAEQAGLPRDAIVLDPGIDFAKPGRR